MGVTDNECSVFDSYYDYHNSLQPTVSSFTPSRLLMSQIFQQGPNVTQRKNWKSNLKWEKSKADGPVKRVMIFDQYGTDVMEINGLFCVE